MTNTLDRPPTISVVMSVYNGGEYLATAIQSILDQTFTNFEFIIIDDGSTDDTLKIIKSFKDPRIKLIRQKNSGLVKSLNRGIKESRGEFIARMDADDISLPQRFEKEVIAISANSQIGMVNCFYTLMDMAGNLSDTQVSPIKNQDLKIMLLYTNPFGHGSAMIRKKAIVQAGLYRDDYHTAEDYDLWRRIDRQWHFTVIPESLYWYRVNPHGISSTKKSLQQESTQKISNELWVDAIPTISILSTISSHHSYKILESPHSRQIANKHIECLQRVGLGALSRHKPRTFVRVFGSLMLISPFQLIKFPIAVSSRLAKKTLIALRLYHR